MTKDEVYNFFKTKNWVEGRSKNCLYKSQESSDGCVLSFRLKFSVISYRREVFSEEAKKWFNTSFSKPKFYSQFTYNSETDKICRKIKG